MEWEEDAFGHANDYDNQRVPGTPLPFALPDEEREDANGLEALCNTRLDGLLPHDAETGVATQQVVSVYLDAMIEMVSRNGLPLSLLCIAVDESPVLRFLGREGGALIGRAVARCLRQETRSHDVIGLLDPDTSGNDFTFLVVCPLLTEKKAAHLGERLRVAMTAPLAEGEHAWLALSVGIATLSLDVTDSKLLIARSMDALRRARRKGGNRVWLHTDTLRTLIEQSDVHFDLQEFTPQEQDENRGADA